MSHLGHRKYLLESINGPEMKIAEFANSLDLDEVAHLDLHCLHSSI